jgi:DNA polymerase (family 10)
VAVGDSSRLADILSGFSSLTVTTETLARSQHTVTIATDRGPVTVHATLPEHKGAALLWHTGSRRHTRQLSARAPRFGLEFEEGQLRRHGRACHVAVTEASVYHHLGLPFIAPELREGTEEIAAAERGALPQLIVDADIRGDLHMHSTWSDGRDSIAAMVRASRQLGYEYVAITDHSERSLASRNLKADDIARQREEIEEVRAQVPGIDVLHGVEVDIMKDGSLDFADTLLEQFDIVLASLHDHGGQQPQELTERYLKAVAHPLVNVITHPANRTPGHFDGYPLDFDVLFAAAAASGTAMEVDGAPGHLDMDGVLARRAASAGVPIVVDSDCHRTDALGRQMRFGVGTARRGWIESQHVLNTRGVDEIRAFVAAKRART